MKSFALVCAGLCMALLLSSCVANPGTGETETVTETATEATDMTCKVVLQNADGTPVSDVILKIRQDDTDVTTKVVGPTGEVSLTLPVGDYTLLLESPTGAQYHYDTDAATLTPDKTETTLTVYPGVSSTWAMSAPSVTSPDAYVSFDAGVVKEGTTYVTLTEGDHTYLVFNPERGGIYEFTCSAGVEFAYHGMPILVYDAPRMSPVDGVLTIPVEATSLGSDSVSQLVFRLNATEGTDTTDALFTVKWTGEIVRSEEEAAAWITVEADPDALAALETFKAPAEGDKWAALTSGTLTDLDVEKDLDLAVVLGEDGYYHYGTADGPMVFVRITSDSRWVEDFVKMCETDRLRAYFYDENGNFLRKEGYNTLFAAYGEVANADGVVPLNEQLAYVIQNTGRHMGWWDFEKNSDIFGDAIVDKDIAWLFACAIYQ